VACALHEVVLTDVAYVGKRASLLLALFYMLTSVLKSNGFDGALKIGVRVFLDILNLHDPRVAGLLHSAYNELTGDPFGDGGVRVVDHWLIDVFVPVSSVEILGNFLAHILLDGVASSRVVVHEAAYVKHQIVKNYQLFA